MKKLNLLAPTLIVSVIVLLAACTSRPRETQPFQARLDSMERQILHSYSPGFGELMLNIQIHHAKLWFAGRNGNWELAAYDQSLIRSAFRKIRTFHPDDPKTTATAMIDIPMDSVARAITLKDRAAFKRGFTFLTTTCNNCHTVTKHPFNFITIPKNDPIGNQSY
jgi:cytochrome c1